MKKFTDTTTLQTTDLLTLKTFSESALFYDIETTGFSAGYNKIYFIGCAFRNGSQITVTQFFSETNEDETDILTAFLKLCRNYTTTITFNGLGFDLPFIQERYRQLNIPEELSDMRQLSDMDHFSGMEHLDIFRLISPLKKVLKLSSLKQKSIEHFLGLNREDIYSGGELIQVYREYIKDQDKQKLYLLQLHNKEDVLGMIDILPVLSYRELFRGNFDVEKPEVHNYFDYEGNKAAEVILTMKLLYPLPKRISYGNDIVYLSGCDDTAKCRVRLYQGELKYFYPNYKDYFYLPKEDMAIHKSVAAYVDKEFREKAKASTCYSKKAGCFLPQFEEIITPGFRENHLDKISYFELTKDFEAAKEVQKKYLVHLLAYLNK